MEGHVPMLAWERLNKLNEARGDLFAAVLRATAKYHEHRDIPTAMDVDEVDAAAAKLTDLAREPERCMACGQEVTSEQGS